MFVVMTSVIRRVDSGEVHRDVQGTGTLTGEVRSGEIDGVRVRWASSGSVDGPFRACLLFRVGRADETLATGGITHLIEHLALFGVGRPCYGFNGCVEPGRTSFVVSGDEAEVSDHLAAVTTALGRLPFERLATEVRVLRTEAAGRGRESSTISLPTATVRAASGSAVFRSTGSNISVANIWGPSSSRPGRGTTSTGTTPSCG
jgi:hypothetical protein